MKKTKTTQQITILLFSLIMMGCNQPKKPSHTKSFVHENSAWADSLIFAYRAFDTLKNVEATDRLINAAELMPVKNWETYLIAATIYSKKGKYDKAFKAINNSIGYGLVDREVLESFQEFSSIKQDKRWANVVGKIDSLQELSLKQVENPQVLKELEDMWKMDQLALSSYEYNISLLDTNATYDDYAELFKPVKDQWEINRQKLDSIISIHGWPGKTLVGVQGSKLSWAIPQHHPNVFFKGKCLALIKNAVDNNDTDPNYYAELHDRIARDTWQKQTYGASMKQNAPYPIKDPSSVNRRRYELGLSEPVEVYALYHGIDYTQPSKDKAITDSIASRDKAQRLYQGFEATIDSNDVESAISYLREAIEHHGDLSGEQLYNAAVRLSQTDQGKAHRLSLAILKVLIWREWGDQRKFLDKKAFYNLISYPEWVEIENQEQKTMFNN